MKTASALTFVFTLSTALLHSQAVPALISYQGKVVDATGTGLGTGTPLNRKILFRIFDAGTGGNRLWSEEQTVTLANGDFSVILGQGVAGSYNGSQETRPSLATVFGGTDRYLEILVDNGDGTLNSTDTPITPRQRLISTAFALRAATADSVASGTDLSLKDVNHGLGWYGTGRPFNGVSLDGPVLYGSGGGALGSVNGSTQNLALRWTNDGKIGIGTASPTEKLDLVGNAKFSGNITAGGTITATGDITSSASVKANGNNGFTFATTGDTDGGLFSPADGVVTFRTNGTERARIDANGNLGIANNNPAEKLDVTGNAKVSGNITASGSVISTTSLTAKAGINFGTNSFGANTTEGGSTGNFIAFGTPGFSEDFLGYDANTFYFKDSPLGGDSTQPSLVVGGAITAGGAITTPGDIISGSYTSGDRFINVRTQGANAYRSGIKFQHHDGTYGWSAFSDERTTDGYGFHLDSIYNNSINTRLFIDTLSGNTGIGTKAPGEKLEVSGNIKATGKVTANGKTAAVGEEELRIVRGTVEANGTRRVGAGFTSSVSGNIYTITFDTAFSSEPSITTASVTSQNGYAIVTLFNVTVSGFKVSGLLSDNHQASNVGFSFIAAGSR